MELPLYVNMKTRKCSSSFFSNYYILFFECKHSGYLGEAPRWLGLELLEWRLRDRSTPGKSLWEYSEDGASLFTGVHTGRGRDEL